MIISRTPLRMSFAGGGSDVKAFYAEFGGAVVSTTVDKYIYVSINKKFDGGIRIAYSKTEEVNSVREIEHRLVRATFDYFDCPGGVEITTIADIPSRGTGLGSSSSFAVGLINALAAYLGRYVSNEELGRTSCHIEIERCGEPIGKQDQYAAAYGGLNLIEFMPDDNVVVSPIVMPVKTRMQFERSVIVFYTGITRNASEILKGQFEEVGRDRAKQRALERMVKLAFLLREELQKANLDAVGDILHENWMLKKSLSAAVSNTRIDEWYEIARSRGAVGGKLLGAGSGGFLMFYAPEDRHGEIAEGLSSLRRVHFGFEPLGSRIIFYNPTVDRNHG